MNARLLMRWLAWFRVPTRFSMRTLLAVMLVAAVLFAWFGWRLRKSQRQAHAIAVLQGLGVVYAYDYQGPITRPSRPPWKLAPSFGRSPYPQRFHKLLGIDFLHNITRVHLETSYRLPDDDIDRFWNALADLHDLTHLEASGPVTRPRAIQRMRNHRRLQQLALRWAHIADEDLAIVAHMPRLQELNLNETPVSDSAMLHVSRAQSLEAIELHHTKIGDAALREIAKLPRLKRLRLSATAVGDDGVHPLRGLETLHDLNVEHTQITDQSLDTIASLRHLENLDLSLTAVTEYGIARLERLTSLKQLRLESTAAAPEALNVLPQLPALEELFVEGSILSGDLSPLAECARLRVLSVNSRGFSSLNGKVKLPTGIEEVHGVSLSPETYELFASLPNLKVVHVSYSVIGVQNAAIVQRFQAARPTVQVMQR